MPKINQEEYEKIKLLPDYDWNWIAREKTGKILSFTNKPTKTDEVWKDKHTRLWFNYKDSQLFQFIQWEDEEPYEIAELIREYEIKELRLAPSGTVIVDSFDESEETEVKKQKLIKNIKSLAREASQQWPHEEMVELRDVLREISQLDEPEVLSQEWLDENKSSWTKLKIDGYYIPVEKLQNLLVPKQEELESKIKVLIEAYKQEDGAYSNPENGWISGFVEDLENLVEEEQKYYVMNEENELILGWSQSAYMTPCIEGYEYMKHNGRENLFQLTEQEIKDYDDRYWTFAKPVEELEEEPMYQALIKGHELIDSAKSYWYFNKTVDGVFVSNLYIKNHTLLWKMTKAEWNKVGINDSNADFVRVERNN